MSAAVAKAKSIEPERIMTKRELKAVICAFRIKLEQFHGVYVARFDNPLLLVPGPTRMDAVEGLLREIGGVK